MLPVLEVERSSLFLVSHRAIITWVVMSCSLLTAPQTFNFWVTKLKSELSMQDAKPNESLASASIESE